MKTYNTYQEAKIANPDCEIVTLIKPDSDLHGLFEPKSVRHIMHPDGGWHICNPADHCMTVEEFLKAGHKFVGGDIVIQNRRVKYMNFDSVCECWNSCGVLDASETYILRAAALEKPRNKVEFVKVDDSIWHLEPDFRRGELFAFDGNRDYVQIETEGDFTLSHSVNNLYRRIETPMTEREAFIETMSRYAVPSVLGKMFDAGCRFVN